MDFDDSWFFMQGPDIVVQRILSGILIRSLFTWQIPAEWGWFMYIWCVIVLFCEIRHMQDSFSDWPHRPLWLTSLLKTCNYKWPESFFIQCVCLCLSFKLSVSPSPPELVWVRVLMQRDAWLTTAVWLSRPDETASSLALHAWCTSIPQNNSQTGLCSLTWPLVPLNRR